MLRLHQIPLVWGDYHVVYGWYIGIYDAEMPVDYQQYRQTFTNAVRVVSQLREITF